MANNLKRDKQEAIIKCLTNGASIRATERIVDVHRDTAMRFMVKVGQGCQRLMDQKMRNLPCTRLEIDEAWTFVQVKPKNLPKGYNPADRGDFWLWCSLCADSKAVPAYRVGKRDYENSMAFCKDLASRMTNRVQLSSDAFSTYLESVWEAFAGDVDYAQVVKTYVADPIGPGRYSPPKVAHVDRRPLLGNPDPKFASTSYVERLNLTTRTDMARLTRLSLAFSKKAENLEAATALHFANYNFVKTHRTVKTAPAVALGLEYRPWTVGELIDRALEA